MEAECFPAISMSSASNRVERSSSPLTSSSSTSTVILKRDNLVPEDNEYPEIKGEPISAPASPCQSSCNMVDDKSTITMVSPKSLQFPKSQLSHTSDSEEDDEEYYQVSRDEYLMSHRVIRQIKTPRHEIHFYLLTALSPFYSPPYRVSLNRPFAIHNSFARVGQPRAINALARGRIINQARFDRT